MRYVVLDTDVASKLLRDRLSPALTGRIAGAVWFVSFVTVGELWRWADARSWGRQSRSELERFLARTVIIDSDEHVSREWAGPRRQLDCGAVRVRRTTRGPRRAARSGDCRWRR